MRQTMLRYDASVLVVRLRAAAGVRPWKAIRSPDSQRSSAVINFHFEMRKQISFEPVSRFLTISLRRSASCAGEGRVTAVITAASKAATYRTELDSYRDEMRRAYNGNSFKVMG